MRYTALPLEVKRVFFNIVHNAVKFTASGGTIRLTVEVKESNVLVAVADTGEGISLTDQIKVFEKFYRVRKPVQTDATAGTGLGLPLAVSIVKAHGGEILLKSEIDKGSTFTVVLPLIH